MGASVGQQKSIVSVACVISVAGNQSFIICTATHSAMLARTLTLVALLATVVCMYGGLLDPTLTKQAPPPMPQVDLPHFMR